MERSIAPQPRVGVALIVINEGKILLIRRKNVHGDGCWSTPGGHLEYGESPETCAAREALEETGVTVSGVHFVACTNDVFEDVNQHFISIFMRGVYESGEAHVAAPYEADACGWYSLDDLPSPLFIPFRHLLEGSSYPVDAFKNK
jgi:8-oxo-dGTP diphosphatase